MLTTIQIFLLAIVLFAFSRVLFRHQDKAISTRAAIFWSIIWLSALFGILLPQTTTSLAEVFGVGRGVDVIVYISLTLLFYLIFRLFVMIEDLRHEITKLIREIALRENTIKPKKKSPRSKK
jgi:small membrane protein